MRERVSIIRGVGVYGEHRKMSSDNFKFESLEDVLNKHLPSNELSEVKRVLYGRSDE